VGITDIKSHRISRLKGVCVAIPSAYDLKQIMPDPRVAATLQLVKTAATQKQFFPEPGMNCVKNVPDGHGAVPKMRGGPSEPAGRSRLQTAVSCFSQKLRW